MREIQLGRVYRHFKGDHYLVEAVAKDSETGEPYVVYRKLYGDGSLWLRPLAKTIADVTGGDLFEILPEAPYTAADLDWKDKTSRSTLEMKDAASRPAISGRVENMAQYDTVFVGFPIWWYQAPRIIETFLERYDFAGKTLIPFATSGGSDMDKTEDILRPCCSAQTAWCPGKRLSSRESAASVREWVESLHC